VIVEVNTELSTDPGLLNRDPYGAGWVAKLKADDWQSESVDLLTGAEGIAAYQAFLEQQGISCE
jgi:glycine cleavage system H protein